MRKKCIHAKKRKRGPYPNPMVERVDFKFANDKDKDRALMRHAWYRKKVALALDTLEQELQLSR